MFIPVAAGVAEETMVVGIVCIVFLILFVVAGVRQIIKNKGED